MTQKEFDCEMAELNLAFAQKREKIEIQIHFNRQKITDLEKQIADLRKNNLDLHRELQEIKMLRLEESAKLNRRFVRSLTENAE